MIDLLSKIDIDDNIENYKGKWRNFYFDTDGKSYSNTSGANSDVFETQEIAASEAESNARACSSYNCSLVFNNGEILPWQFSHALTLPDINTGAS